VAKLENAPDLAGKNLRHSQVRPLPRMFNLLSDRKEEREVATYNTWVADPMFKILSNFKASLETSPPIKVGTPDP
jgi:hypothetical protein